MNDAERIAHYQPVGLCEHCLKLCDDPYMNCPRAQTLRESGAKEYICYCGDYLGAPVQVNADAAS